MAGILRESCILCAHMHARERERQRETERESYILLWIYAPNWNLYIQRAHTQKKKKNILAKGKMKYGTQV